MHRVWIDSEIPVEFHGPSLNLQNIGKIGYFGHFLQAISPFVIVVVSISLVLMSFYGTPSTLTIREAPIVFPPKHFLVVAHGINVSNSTIVESVFDSNFPFMNLGQLFPTYGGSRLFATVTQTKHLVVNVSMPPWPTKFELRHLNVLLPITLEFPNLNRRGTHTLLHLQIAHSKSFNQVNSFGRLIIQQQHLFADTDGPLSSRIEEVLQSVASLSGPVMENVISGLTNGPFIVKHVITEQTIRIDGDGTGFEGFFTFRVPEIFVETGASFWNMFKVTYVQLFYWFFLVYFVWRLFVRTGFKYGIIESSVRYPLKFTKLHAD
jgi:hypothetical protein